MILHQKAYVCRIDVCLYRIDAGYGMALVCFWTINTILFYISDGTDLQRPDRSNKMHEAASAAFVGASHFMVAAWNRLWLQVDLATSMFAWNCQLL